MAAATRGEARQGDWLVAERQTAGRGRLGRDWVSPAGNLYASGLVVVRPGDPAPSSLALVAGVALFETLSAWTLAIRLKWPNDLLSLDGAKLGGILLERAGDAIVVGVGVNLSQAPEIAGRAATSLAALNIDPPTTRDVAERLAATVADWIDRWRTQGLEGIREAWLARAHPPGTALSASLPDGSRVDGAFAGLSADCALQLRLADGALRVIHAGDIVLV